MYGMGEVNKDDVVCGLWFVVCALFWCLLITIPRPFKKPLTKFEKMREELHVCSTNENMFNVKKASR